MVNLLTIFVWVSSFGSTQVHKLKGTWEVEYVYINKKLLKKSNYSHFYGRISFVPSPKDGVKGIYTTSIRDIDIIGRFCQKKDSVILEPKRVGWPVQKFRFSIYNKNLLLSAGSKKFILKPAPSKPKKSIT